MPKLPIVIAPDERLTTRASEVTDINDKIKELVNDMFETMYDAEGLGLAAVQVGVLKRIFVMDVRPEKAEDELVGYDSVGKFCMINPEIKELSDEQVIMSEGCLSIPEQSHEIKRPKYLTVKYKNLNNEEQTLKASGWLARCIQHELDHLNGILYIRHLSKLKYDMAMRRAQKVKKNYE
ncbi:polypeptide deformylase [Wolbachia endosymbiont of Armadillidium vulgare str. wVulC]|uniref:Peptide deformylase n=1 Tax=Wolbachia endosymbiont of Armadillidium arcangelii TaxID=3158571 RepID=A0AAU7Q3I6_9RICK|nr:peptide deformylase [Wolbachia endosymbiont of Armadillidium vulgare]KLT23320.1 polypeptide deformylase [Wolbachia endosymbiont of Armadillidium vulgare str. wVulC]OJH30894.1 Peptide deformylase [Wolbachia endosymbiont of Armadillidium vulgare]